MHPELPLVMVLLHFPPKTITSIDDMGVDQAPGGLGDPSVDGHETPEAQAKMGEGSVGRQGLPP